MTHAHDRLEAQAVAGLEHAQRAAVFRRFLKIESERLRIRHRFGLSGEEIAAGRAFVTDLVVSNASLLVARELSGDDTEPPGWAVVALGGYGRRELAPFSDVDLLFLRGRGRSDFAKALAERVLYLLWDAGLTVGHSFRSTNECVAMATDDLHSRNAMSEARFVAGDRALFADFARTLEDRVLTNRRRTPAYLDTMRAEIEARYAKYGRAVCVQEPNVKESAGGLRDLHAVLWVGRAAYGCRDFDDLREGDRLSGAEYAAARRAYDFLWRVRHEAHYVGGRQADLLTLDVQPTLAANLGFVAKNGLHASELFMREYYQRAQELNRVADRFLTTAFEPKRRLARFALLGGRKDLGNFESEGGLLYPSSRAIGPAGPRRVLEAFLAAQATGLELSEDLKQIVRDGLPQIDRHFRHSREAGSAFVELLKRKGRVGPALRRMHELGALGRLMPEFGRVTFLVQHDLYHKYTIDEHTLKAVEALDGLHESNDPKLARFSRLMADVVDPMPLYLGVLLHDIGKGRGGGHVAKGARIAERICLRLRLEDRAASSVLFLVRQHLLLSHTSQRRNLAEPRLIRSLAREVGTLERLDMLTLLTFADTSAVAPGVWTEWKESLLWELYERLREELGRGERRDGVVELKARVLERLPRFVTPGEAERHFAMLSERSLRGADPDTVARQVALVGRLGRKAVAVAWRPAVGSPFTELTVCARDTRGLLAKLAGTLTANRVNILSVDVATRLDGIALDTFVVAEAGAGGPVPEQSRPALEKAIEGAIAGEYDVAAAVGVWRAKVRRPRRRGGRPPAAPVVAFDSTASDEGTVVEVRAEDEPGLVYTIANALARRGLDIRFAKIATEKHHALDVFYVADGTGRKLDPAAFSDIERSLSAAIGESAAGVPTTHAAPARSTA